MATVGAWYRAGRLLIFRAHARCSCMQGLPPRSGNKYILSTYLEFTAKPA
ncbi:hypothetical protein FHR56_003583 [Xanthomonas sacchari]|nr:MULTISPECIES: hypothetical protein [unclassified Xanthomonas]MBB6368404.1 hypothetical protein [Xanthomonas sp. F10]